MSARLTAQLGVLLVRYGEVTKLRTDADRVAVSVKGREGGEEQR